MKRMYISLLLCVLFAAPISAKKVLLVELDALFYFDEALGVDILLKNLVNYYRVKLIDVLATSSRYKLPNSCKLYYKDKQLPALWCAYLAGDISSERAYDDAIACIQKNTSFISAERRILYMGADVAFKPESEIRIMKLLSPMYDLMVESITSEHQADTHVIFFSNKTNQTIKALKNKYSDLRMLLKDRVFNSAKFNLLKPSSEFYSLIFETFHVSPRDCYVIETEKNYLKAAQAMGLDGFHLTGNFDELRSYLHNKKFI